MELINVQWSLTMDPDPDLKIGIRQLMHKQISYKMTTLYLYAMERVLIRKWQITSKDTIRLDPNTLTNSRSEVNNSSHSNQQFVQIINAKRRFSIRILRSIRIIQFEQTLIRDLSRLNEILIENLR